jgi:hypothetical protein
MIIGEYPFCGELLFTALPDRPLPCFGNNNCPKCGTLVWHKFSRGDPQSWTDEEFSKEFDIDEESKQITKNVA